MRPSPIWVPMRDVLVHHDLQLIEHGGLVGVRDFALLESALARPKNIAYSPESASLPRLAAAYAFGIASNHPFVDGNKRTALVVAYTFLALNGIEVRAAQEEAYLAFRGVAEGSIGEDEFAAWFEEYTSPA